jgi:hypothetical protein
MKNAFIAVAALATVFSAQAAPAHEDVNQQKLSRGKMTIGETSTEWKVEHTGCSKDKHMVTMVSNGRLYVADPLTLAPEKVGRVADIYNRLLANAVGEWLFLEKDTAKVIETGIRTGLTHEEVLNKNRNFDKAEDEFTNAVQDELGIKITGHSMHFKVENISPAPSPECQ